MDPTLPNLDPLQSGITWSALESFASHIRPKSTTCFLIQTSSCLDSDKTDDIDTVNIQNKAKPAFRSFIDSGNVRISFIDYKKYHLSSCNNYGSPSNAWMMEKYWTDEFSPLDSDMVLTIQTDSVLCTSFDPEPYREFAYVGAPWPPRADMHNNPVPPEGVCRFITERWKKWTTAAAVNATRTTNTKNQDDTTFFKAAVDACRDKGDGPVGNGGLSLRSRKWLIKAIRACPHANNGYTSKTCMLTEDMPEDLYFATVLRGINAPMPSAFEANLFSSEMILPEQALEYYGLPEGMDMDSIVKKRWGDVGEGWERYVRMKARMEEIKKDIGAGGKKEMSLLPIGFHKPWLYVNMAMIRISALREECPDLEAILPEEALKKMAKAAYSQRFGRGYETLIRKYRKTA